MMKAVLKKVDEKIVKETSRTLGNELNAVARELDALVVFPASERLWCRVHGSGSARIRCPERPGTRNFQVSGLKPET